MATYFRNTVNKEIGTTPVTVLDNSNNSKMTVVGISLANVSESNLFVDVTVTNDLDVEVHYVKQVMLPPNSSMRLIAGGEKLILGNDNQIKINSNLADSIDAIVDVQHVEEQFPEIFNWIRLFGTNISLIIIIMIIVGGVNMITALLVLILEQTQLIGITRVLGAKVASLQQLFLIQGAYLIGVGLVWGNLIGLGLLFIQQQTGFVSLDPNTYYVKEVPVYMDVTTVLWLNGLTLAVCLVLLVLPSFIISRIPPTQVLKINP